MIPFYPLDSRVLVQPHSAVRPLIYPTDFAISSLIMVAITLPSTHFEPQESVNYSCDIYS
jgi:hypothetical protein